MELRGGCAEREAGGTFGIVVEDAVVSAGVGVGVPERGGAAAERGGLQLLLRQSLLHLGPQSLDEPAQSHRQPVYQDSFTPMRTQNDSTLMLFSSGPAPTGAPDVTWTDRIQSTTTFDHKSKKAAPSGVC